MAGVVCDVVGGAGWFDVGRVAVVAHVSAQLGVLAAGVTVAVALIPPMLAGALSDATCELVRFAVPRFWLFNVTAAAMPPITTTAVAVAIEAMA